MIRPSESSSSSEYLPAGLANLPNTQVGPAKMNIAGISEFYIPPPPPTPVTEAQKASQPLLNEQQPRTSPTNTESPAPNVIVPHLVPFPMIPTMVRPPPTMFYPPVQLQYSFAGVQHPLKYRGPPPQAYVPPTFVSHYPPHMMPPFGQQVVLVNGIPVMQHYPQFQYLKAPERLTPENKKILSLNRKQLRMEQQAKMKVERAARRSQKAREKQERLNEKKIRKLEECGLGKKDSKDHIFSKDRFLIRLKDLGSFNRGNEIWRVENHVLIHKFRGVPSMRAPAKQFQSTNRLSGYDMRAEWRFFAIDNRNVEYDKVSSEITIHQYPPIGVLLEAKNEAEKKDEEFKDTEVNEYREKLLNFQNKQTEKRNLKTKKKLEKMAKRAEKRASSRMLKYTNNDSRLATSSENSSKRSTSHSSSEKLNTSKEADSCLWEHYITTSYEDGNDSKNIEDVCKSVLHNMISVIADSELHDDMSDYESMSDSDEDSDIDVGSLTSLADSSSFDASQHAQDMVMDNMKMEILEAEEIPDVALELEVC